MKLRASPVILSIFFLLLMNFPGLAYAQEKRAPAVQRMTICMIQLEHADAANLASVLAPLLSPEGNIAAYRPTNTLIIKDRAYIVDMLAKIIKGKPCTPVAQTPETEGTTGRNRSRP